MDDTELVLLGVTLGLGVIVFLASLLERRTKQKGAFFGGPPTRGQRIFAFLLAVFFGGVVLFTYFTSGRIFVLMALVAVACLAYSMGAISVFRALNYPQK